MFDRTLRVVRWLLSQRSKSKRTKELVLLKDRWENRPPKPQGEREILQQRPFENLEVRVINLERRSDRLESVSEQLKQVGIHRFEKYIGIDGRKEYPGINPLVGGSIGCELSHISAVSAGASDATEAIMICEDDLVFLCSQDELESIVAEFLANPSLDVLCLSGRPRGGSLAISPGLRLVIGLVGRGCYIVKPHVAGALVRVFAQGLFELDRGSLAGKGDLTWRRLQLESLFFAFPRKDIACQAEGFSDIEGRELGPR